jgi:hypothetical protein
VKERSSLILIEALNIIVCLKLHNNLTQLKIFKENLKIKGGHDLKGNNSCLCVMFRLCQGMYIKDYINQSYLSPFN